MIIDSATVTGDGAASLYVDVIIVACHTVKQKTPISRSQIRTRKSRRCPRAVFDFDF